MQASALVTGVLCGLLAAAMAWACPADPAGAAQAAKAQYCRVLQMRLTPSLERGVPDFRPQPLSLDVGLSRWMEQLASC